jgi:hypothetical protein
VNLNPDFTNKQIHLLILGCALAGLGVSLLERAFGLSWMESVTVTSMLMVLSGFAVNVYRLRRGAK